MKKLTALLINVMILLVTAACTGGNGKPEGPANVTGAKVSGVNHTLKVWAAQEDQSLTRELADRFIAANPQYSVTVELGVVGEPDTYKTYSEDPEAAADVFSFPNDQLRDFVAAGGLYEITRKKDDIITRNGEGSVGSATVNGKLYAYPATADNGYFLYYDSSVRCL